MARGKVFGIGLNKTGTRSLASATRLLGLRTMHKGDEATSALVDRAADEGVPLLTHLGAGFDAYFDVHGLVTRFAEVDAQYPGSRFILTTRDLDGWLDSREKHVQANRQREGYDGTFLTVDRQAWIAEREAHHAAVHAYFAGRTDLLVLDVVDGERWEVLAPFLGVRAPRVAFPWENLDGKGTYRPERAWDRARRRGRYVMARGVRRVGR